MKHLSKTYFFVKNPKKQLSKEASESISRLSNRDPLSFLLQLSMAWAIIFISIYLAITINNFFLNILLIIVIAIRQNVLGLLVHEQAHCLGFKSKIGDKFTNFFCAYPLIFLTVENYAQAHLSHHKFFMKDNDQDLLRKSGNNWSFPMKKSRLIILILSDLFCLNIISLFKGKKLNHATTAFKRPNPTPIWLHFSFYFILIALLTYTHLWGIFLLFWLLPLLTVAQVIVRWGAICEHLYIAKAEIEECTPVIINTWWERLLIPNLNFTLHAYHHWFPGVPFSNLPKIHKLFVNENLVNKNLIFYGNFSYLKFLMKKELLQTNHLNHHSKFHLPVTDEYNH